MAQGKREESRAMLLAQRWAIGSLFGDEPESEQAVAEFIRTGTPPTTARDYDRNKAAVDAKVAEIRANGGKVVF